MVHLPPEIWLNVAAFIPDEVLSQIRCVNGVFLDLGMNIRWKEVTITTRNILQAMTILRRLSEPFIARRLKALTMCLVAPDPIESNTMVDTFVQENILPYHLFGTETPQFYKLGMRSFCDVLDTIVTVSRDFVNLSQLTIDFSIVSPTYHFRLEPFFHSLWSSVGKGLHGLALKGNVKGYQAVLKSNPVLSSLKELGLELITDKHDVDGSVDTDALLDAIVPFIRRLNPHLEDLKIRSYPSRSPSADLSPFFVHLPTFPSLQSLDVHVAFNKITNPSGLKDLLLNSSSTLQRLTLRLNPSFSVFSRIEERLGEWLFDCLADAQCFSRVQYLDFYPTKEHDGLFLTLGYIQRTSQHLKELIIRDRYWHTDEATMVIEAAAGCRHLTSIHFNVWSLDITLIDYLFENFPHLENLRISTVESHVSGFPYNFIQELKNRFYVGWQLQEISLCYGDRPVETDTMRALARSIPSLKGFFGSGPSSKL